MSSIDRVDWHYGNNFPKELPKENGGTHIGLFISWIIESGLIGEIHTNDSSEGIQKVKRKEITGRDFLFEFCDGKLWNEDLNEVGVLFAEDYYSSDQYFNDYANLLAAEKETVYHIENNWENYSKLKKILDVRFKKWNSQRNKKKWQFWK